MQQKIKLRNLLAAAAIMLCFLPEFAQAQYHNNTMSDRWAEQKRLDYWKHVKETYGQDHLFRYELTGGVFMTSASYKLKATAFDYDKADPVLDAVSKSGEIKPEGLPFHLGINYGFKLSQFKEDAALILTCGLSYDQMQFKIPNVKLAGYDREFNFTTGILGVPLFLDYKRGAESDLDVERKKLFTMGAGFLPSYFATVGEAYHYQFLLRPGVRIEFGRCTKYGSFKIQAMSIIGNVPIANEKGIERKLTEQEHGGPMEVYDVQLKGGSQFFVSLSLVGMTQIWRVD